MSMNWYWGKISEKFAELATEVFKLILRRSFSYVGLISEQPRTILKTFIFQLKFSLTILKLSNELCLYKGINRKKLKEKKNLHPKKISLAFVKNSLPCCKKRKFFYSGFIYWWCSGVEENNWEFFKQTKLEIKAWKFVINPKNPKKTWASTYENWESLINPEIIYRIHLGCF